MRLDAVIDMLKLENSCALCPTVVDLPIWLLLVLDYLVD